MYKKAGIRWFRFDPSGRLNPTGLYSSLCHVVLWNVETPSSLQKQSLCTPKPELPAEVKAAGRATTSSLVSAVNPSVVHDEANPRA